MDAIQRQQFADFLDRLAAEASSDSDCEEFLVRYYTDDFLEEVRVCVVRLEIGRSDFEMKSVEGRNLLRAWAVLLRTSLPNGA